MQVAECPKACEPDRALRDTGEHGVAQLAKCLRHDPCKAIENQQRDGHGNDGAGCRSTGCQAVDSLFVEDRHCDVGAFGRGQKY